MDAQAVGRNVPASDFYGRGGIFAGGFAAISGKRREGEARFAWIGNRPAWAGGPYRCGGAGHAAISGKRRKGEARFAWIGNRPAWEGGPYRCGGAGHATISGR